MKPIIWATAAYLITQYLTGCSTAAATDQNTVIDCQQVTIEFSTEIRVCPMPDGSTCYLHDSGSISCIAGAAQTERRYVEGTTPEPNPDRGGDGREPKLDEPAIDSEEILR